MAAVNPGNNNSFSLKTSSSSWTYSSGSIKNVTINQDTGAHIEFNDKNGNTLGVLKMEDGIMTFQGDVDKSAQKFFDKLVKDKVKQYIKENYK